jgi:hypothetical protein
MSDTAIEYGRKEIDGKMVSYGKYKDHLDRQIELLSIPNQNLVVVVDGKIYQSVTEVPNHRMMSYGESNIFSASQMQVNEYVFIWTKIAGWIGNDDLCNQVFNR